MLMTIAGSLIFLTAALQAPVPAQPAVRAGAQDAPASKPARPKIYDESADAKTQILAALARAKKENRRVLIQWGANWCGWCHLLHGLMKSDRAIAQELTNEYDLVMVDMGDGKKNIDIANKYGAIVAQKGLPYLTVLDSEGEVVANQETGVLEAKINDKDGHDPAKVLGFLKQNQAPALDAQAVVKEATARAAAEKKLVFLHLGAPWCGWCHKLENWMAQPEIKAILDKEFLDVKVDVDRMTHGKDVQKVYDPELGGIPVFVFLGADGSTLASSMTPKGTIGYPYQPEEVAHFTGMLKKARKALTDDDIAKLEASLNKVRTDDEARKSAK